LDLVRPRWHVMRGARNQRRHMADFDLAIIGGGVNGAGIARDAAGRGLSVLLVEQNDLASGTSSKSTKLIHGGLRYLEFYAFRMVREALIEREVLIGIAPHLTRPLRFVLPHHAGLRPVWILRLGLFLYDHLGGREILPPTDAVDLTHHPVGEPLKREYRQGFIYSDGWVDDARLVVLNADGRIVFAIPYEGDFTLIGTTDQDFKGDLAAPTASAAEINYLCGAVNAYFRKGVTPDQVVHAYSGVRQLYDDGARSAQNLTREYVLDLEAGRGEAPLLTVYGGKITTYRRLAEAALAKLAGTYKGLAGGLPGPWTATA